MISPLKRIIKRIIFTFIKPETKIIYSSYSQSGEDVIVQNLFKNIGIHKISYLNIGVCHPEYSDNTYLFYKSGSSGVCVEANPSLIKDIQVKRSRDKVINVGVGAIEINEAEFFLFNDPNLSTFDKEEAIRRDKTGVSKILNTIKIPIKSINNIIAQNFQCCPDFLSLDVEGLDLDVLKSLNYVRFPIPVICVETCAFSGTHIKPKIDAFDNVMHDVGYFVYADTYVNTIYVNQKWFNTRDNKHFIT